MREHKEKPDFDLDLCLQKIKSKNRLNYIVNVDINGQYESKYFDDDYDYGGYWEKKSNTIKYSEIELISESIKSQDCSDNLHINLQHNSIGNINAKLLSDACMLGKIGLSLDLSHNDIEDVGAIAFANGIKSEKYPHYFHLNLTNNKITTTGARALLNALKSRNRPYGLNIDVEWSFDYNDKIFKQQYDKTCIGLEGIERQALLKNHIGTMKNIIERKYDIESNLLEKLPNFCADDLYKASTNLLELLNDSVYYIEQIEANCRTLSRASYFLFEHKWGKDAAIYKETLSHSIGEEIKNQFIRQKRINNFIDTQGVIYFTFLLSTKDFIPIEIARYILLLEIINISIDDLIDIENETPKNFAQDLSKQTAERYSYYMKNCGLFKIKPTRTVGIETIQQQCKRTLSFGIQQLLEQNDKPIIIELKHGKMIIAFDSSSDANSFLKALKKDTYFFQKVVKLDDRKEINYVINNICKLDPDDVYQAFPEFLSPNPSANSSWF